MSVLDQITEEETPVPTITPEQEMAELRAKCELLGMKAPHAAATADTIRKKIAEHLAGAEKKDEPMELTKDTPPAAPAAVVAVVAPVETAGAKRARLRKESLALVRINVQCLDPAKKEWEGEIFTVGNATVGTVKRFVPFNTTEGYHVERILYEVLKARECQVFETKKLKNGGQHREGKLKREFAIELLPALTQSELDELARRQALAGSIEQ